MRWLLMIVVLMCAPVSFMDEDTEEPSISVIERGTCPGGKCPPKRPRPSK